MSVIVENVLYIGSNIKLVEIMLNEFYGDLKKPTYKICHLLSCVDIQSSLEETNYSHFICEQAINAEITAKIQTQFPSLKTFYLGNSEAQTTYKSNIIEDSLQGEQVLAALDAISIPIYYRNDQKVFLACNICFSRLLGLLPEQIIGKTFSELFPRNILRNKSVVKKIDPLGHQVTIHEGEFHDAAGISREVSIRLESIPETNMHIGMIFDVQERNDAKRLLEKEKIRLRATADIASELIFFKDLAGRFLGCNKPFEKFIGRSEKDIIGKTDDDFFASEQVMICQAQDQKVMTKNTVYSGEEYLTSSNGERHFVEMKKVPLTDKDGTVQGLIGVTKDITAKHILRKNLNVANVVFENSKDSIIVTDAHSKVISANNSASRIFGFLKSELLIADISILFTDSHGSAFYNNIQKTLTTEKYWQGEISYATNHGAVYYAWLEVYAVEQIDEGSVEHIYSYTDLTQFQSEQEKILFLSKHDPLTGLYNRIALFHRMEDAIKRATYKQSAFAVMLINLDNFQRINHQYGHNSGDKLLKDVAQRLKPCISEKDMIARFVGVEFVIIIDELINEQDATLVAQKVAEQFNNKFQIEDEAITLTASIGISLYPDDGIDVDSMLVNADKAMLRGQTDKATTSHFYTNELTRNSNHQLKLEEQLKQALAFDQFELYYKPQYDLSKKLIVAVESCLRWNHPKQGVLLPIQFVSLVEASGLLVPLGLNIMRKAMLQAVIWNKKGIHFGRIAISIDKAQLLQMSFVADILSLLQQTSCAIDWLEFEIDETIFITDSASIQDNLANISKLGISLTVVSLGLDRTILYSIEKLSIEKIKISEHFFHGIPGQLTGEAMVKATIVFARSLGLNIVGDDIGSAEQEAFSSAQYIDSTAGRGQVKAMKPAEATFFLNSHKRK